MHQGVHLLQPGGAFIGICRLQGDDAELVYVAMLPDVDNPVHALAEIFVGADYVGNLHSGDVETLGRGDEGDAVLREFLADRSEWNVCLAGSHNLAVNLVAYHLHSVPEADLAQAHQLFAAPKAPARIVGIAEQEGLGGRVCAAALDVVPVHLVALESGIP